LRRLLLILISFAILSQTLSSAIIFVSYSLNKDFITSNFCINKDKPKLHCQGKCHLIKELKDQEQKESVPVSSSKEKLETIVYLTVKNSLPLTDNKPIQQIFTPYLERQLADFFSQPFQPPKV